MLQSHYCFNLLREMKFFVLLICCAIQILTTESKIIPDRLPQPCRKSEPNYSQCTYKVLEKMGPHLLRGVRELNFPKMNPLDIPLFIVNRTLNNLVSIDAVLKNLQFSGYDTAQIESFKFDPQNMNGELRLNMPYFRGSFEYAVSGRLLGLTLNDAGYFKGNYTNVGLYFKFSLKQVDKLGVKYYTFDDFRAKGTIGDGFLKLTSKNPEDQAAADLIVNFANENFKTSFEAIKPIYDESMSVFYKFLAEQVLNTVPAAELIPE